MEAERLIIRRVPPKMNSFLSKQTVGFQHSNRLWGLVSSTFYPVCNSYPEQFNEQKFASYCILRVQTQYWTYLVSTYTDTSVLQVQSNNSPAIYLKPLVLFDVKVPRTITRLGLGLGPASNKPRPGEFAEKSENVKEDAAESIMLLYLGLCLLITSLPIVMSLLF